MGLQRKRLDLLLVEQGLAEDQDAAQRLIGAGCVIVNNHRCDKSGTQVPVNCSITLRATKTYVSRGGDKLAAGLQAMELSAKHLICADIGCSTGGFTDCLLQHGAAKVYAVDVGYGILDWRLRQDPRVVVLERTNARTLSAEHIPESLDLVVIDASFISLEPLLAPLLPLFSTFIRILALVKPQFQLPREYIGSGGIVRETHLHDMALDMVRTYGEKLGLSCVKSVACPVKGAKGNQEFFMLLEGQHIHEAPEFGITQAQGDKDDREE